MIEIFRTRRSIRKYKRHKIEPGKISVLKEVLLRSPSSKNINPWEFIFIDDPDLINKLGKCKSKGTNPLETAPLAILICAEETKNDTWIEDCSIAAAMLQIAAYSLGLGSCWIQIRNRFFRENISSEEYIRGILHIPSIYKVLCFIAIGYPDEKIAGRPESELQYEKIRWNGF